MKTYKRKNKSRLHDTVKRYETGHPPARETSIVVNLKAEPQRLSLLRLQHGFAGLCRNRQRIAMRLSKAVAAGDDYKAAHLAKLLEDTSRKAHNVASEIASRKLLPWTDETGDPTPAAPKPSGKRITRKSKLHTRVRAVPATMANVSKVPSSPAKPTETTRQLETERETARRAFELELKSRD